MKVKPIKPISSYRGLDALIMFWCDPRSIRRIIDLKTGKIHTIKSMPQIDDKYKVHVVAPERNILNLSKMISGYLYYINEIRGLKK